MRIECIPNVSDTHAHSVAGKTVFVIDALRATSTMTAALSNGAKSIVPVETVAQAKSTAKEGDLLAGERKCKKVPGFHLGNSPLEFTEDAVKGRRIVMTTTNGTRGIQKALKAAHVLAGSFLNAAACARVAVELKRDVVLLCAGTKDVFALEDGLCAGLLACELRAALGDVVSWNDLAAAMEGAYHTYADQLEQTLLACDSGIRLAGLGFVEDVSWCAKVNVSNMVPALIDGELRPFSLR